MFTIFSKEKEPLTERAKVDELLTKVQNPALTAAIAQLRFQLNTEGVTFTVAANHLNAAVSQTPDYQMARQLKSNTTSNYEGGGGRSGGRGSG
jgi:outer membrane murein-binding lipoprotein Lpp